MQYQLTIKPSERPVLRVRSLLAEWGCSGGALAKFLPKPKKVRAVKPKTPVVPKAIVDVRTDADLPMFETDYSI